MSEKKHSYLAGEKDKDFRIVYCNHAGFQFNGFEAIIKFGVVNDLSDPNGGYVDQVAVAMNPSNVKALAISLGAMVKSHEETTGSEIPINPDLQKNIEAAIAAAKKTRGA